MNPDNTLCQRLGIKQKDLANYLGISPATMAQFEIGRRSLPSAANLKLARLELLWQQLSSTAATTPTRPHPKKQQQKKLKLLQQHANACAIKMQRAEKLLQHTTNNWQKADRLLQLLDAMEPEATQKADKLWMEIMRHEAEAKLDQHGAHQQAKLQLRFSGLQQQHAIARQMLKEMIPIAIGS